MLGIGVAVVVATVMAQAPQPPSDADAADAAPPASAPQNAAETPPTPVQSPAAQTEPTPAPTPPAEPAPAPTSVPAAEPGNSTPTTQAASQPGTAPAPSVEKPRLMVVPLAGFGLEGTLRDTVQEAINSEAVQVGGAQFEVTTSSALEKLLNLEQMKQVLGCSDPRCVVDIGQQVNAEKMLACTAGSPGGDNATVSCRLLDVRAGAVLKDVDRVVLKEPRVLAEAARAVVGIVLVGQARERSGLVQLKVSEGGAKVMVDGKEVATSPLAEPLKLDEGLREIVIEKSGYARWRTRLDVQAGSFTVVDAKLAATRTIVLAPFGLAAGTGGLLMGGAAVGLGLTFAAVAECLYHGYVGGTYGTPVTNAVGAPNVWASTSGLCSLPPLSIGAQRSDGTTNPAYKQRPIDSYERDDRYAQVVLFGNILANVAFGAAAVLLVLGLTAGVALVATDLIIRVVRREE